MSRRNVRRFKSVLGLWLLTFGLLVSPFLHIAMEHGHSHSHGAASHSHGVPLTPAHEHAPWSVEHFLAVFVVAAVVVAHRVALRFLSSGATPTAEPFVHRAGFVPAMPQGP